MMYFKRSNLVSGKYQTKTIDKKLLELLTKKFKYKNFLNPRNFIEIISEYKLRVNFKLRIDYSKSSIYIKKTITLK